MILYRNFFQMSIAHVKANLGYQTKRRNPTKGLHHVKAEFFYFELVRIGKMKQVEVVYVWEDSVDYQKTFGQCSSKS